MKIVHSYWSKPSLEKNVNNPIYNKNNGGWRALKYNYYSWAYSCLKFKEYYKHIELVTDTHGYQLFIEQLKLPYTSVKVELDRLNKYPSILWAIGKLYAFSIQDEAFLHTDGDVFIWKPFEKRIEEATLVAQHPEVDEGHYTYALKLLKENNFTIPALLEKDIASNNHKIISSNAGIIGGTDFNFFKSYSKKAFEFIDMNMHNLNDNILGSSYAIMYEQFLFAAMARNQQINITHLFDQEEMKSLNLSNFINKYSKKAYSHILSQMKRQLIYCKELEDALKYDYPDTYNRINGYLLEKTSLIQ